MNILLDKKKLKIVLRDEGIIVAKKKRGIPRFKILFYILD